MRTLGALLLLSWLAASQLPLPQAPPSPGALVRGVLLERDKPDASGQFSIRCPDNQVFRYQFDRKTYVERESASIDIQRLNPGDKVEVLSDVVPGTALRYARTIHVLAEVAPPRPLSAGRVRAYRKTEEPLRMIPVGNLTYSGVVFRLNPERLVLHVRVGTDQTILLRTDTRFVQNGENVEAQTLQPNMRVFVRAGKDIYDQVEAYQVVWGSILAPQ